MSRLERLARARKHIESTAGSGKPLSAEPALRRHLSRGGRDPSPIRLHTGAEAQRITALLGAAAVTSGADIFLAADCFDPGTDAGLRLIEHEFVHVGQQSERDGPLNKLAASGGTYCGTPGDPWERRASAGVPGGHAASAFRARPPRPGAIIQCHDSFEHRVLGDLRTADFTALGGPQRQDVIQRQLDLLWNWHQNPTSVTEQTVNNLCPWIRTLRLPASGLLVTYGELNALPDYIATGPTADTLPASILLPVLQVIRQEGFRGLSALLGRSVNNQFEGAPFPPAQYPIGFINKITQSLALDTLTLSVGRLGTDHYTGLLGRNACHFAPFSWYRWQASHLIASDLARRAHAASDPNEKARLEHGAWVHAGYADHFLQDSFAAGHLCNKTLIMQWFIEWAANAAVVVQDWDLIKDMTTARQPGLAGRNLYSPIWAGGSNDPQTAEDKATYLERRAAVGLAATPDIAVTYQDYFAFLSSLIAQSAGGAIHDHYNEASLWVGSVARPQPFEIYGDNTLLTGAGGAAGINATSEAAQLSQQSIRELLDNGTTSITTQQLRDQFPTSVRGAGNTMLSLEQWNDTQKDYCVKSVFPGLHDLIVGAVSPRIANISVDQDMWPRWSTSLPGSGYEITTVLPLGGRVFAASAGRAYELDQVSGVVLRSLAVGGSGDTRLAGDGSNLYVACAGAITAIDLRGNWAAPRWHMNLDGAGGNTVDVLAHQGRLFAGCNGYMYEIGLDGGARHRVKLGSFTGDYTTSICADATMLYAGTHGYAYGVRLDGGWSKYDWDASLTSAGYNHVDVLIAGGRLFAGSYGYAYEVNPGNGQVLQKTRPTSWAWSPGGSYDTHLAVAGGVLAVATHGWVYGLDLSRNWAPTSAKWAADMSGNRYQEAYVAAVGGDIYAGSYGYVWRIDAATGEVTRKLLLTSRIWFPGDYVTRVAATTPGALYAGVHGYVNSVALLIDRA
ncbi:MAG: eCIS core domain-containing protein [Mycobacterium sp.]